MGGATMRPVLAGAAGRMLPAAAALAFVAALVCVAPPARAATTRYWTDGSGQWNVSSNWDPSGQPQGGNNVYLTQSDGADRTVTYYNIINPDAHLNSLTIDATGLGTMTLNMPNAHALSVHTEYVGYDGKGAVTQSAGMHSAETLYLGYSAAGEGAYTLTGGTLGSTDLYVGYYGAGTLTVAHGGMVTAVVLWASASDLLGSGTITATQGAVLDADMVFDGTRGKAQTVVPFGTGGTLNLTVAGGRLAAGYKGTGSLRVAAGAAIASGTGYLGYNSGSTGTATVTGGGSTWANSSYLHVGYSGAGTLNIEAGGQVSNTNGYLGYSSGSTGAATVTGDGSTWTSSGDLYVGYEGAGTLTVADGGLVTAKRLYASVSSLLGNGTISVHGAVLDANLVFDGTHGLVQALPFGAGGTLNLNVDGTGGLGVGYKATGTLRIAQGRTVASASGCLGKWSDSTGTATVTGAGSRWTNSGGLSVGSYGTGTLTIEAGGRVSNTYGQLGYSSGSTGQATVTGADSTWTNSDELWVGDNGTGMVDIEAGGKVSNTRGYLGFWSGSTGTASVTGAGSTWTNSWDLYVGYGGTGTLNIDAGGQVSSTAGRLGRESGSTGTATVTGDGSTWTNSSTLSVGYYGAGTLTIAAGGQVSNSGSSLGGRSGVTSTATVTGAGSMWTNSGDLSIGGAGTGTLNIEAGGRVSSRQGFLGGGSGSTATATVTGADSTWTNSDELYVGDEGSSTLNIEAGGQVSNTDGCIGYDSGSTGTVTVDGTGSVWNNTNSLYVGGSSSGAGGMGSLTVQNGGQVTVGGTLKTWEADSAITVKGGALTAGVLTGSTGTIRTTDPAGGAALTVGSAASGTFSAALRDDTGPGSLTKIGAGTQTLAGGGITYTGATTVLGGILKLSNTTAFASNILNSAATEFEVTTGTWTFGRALGGAGAFVKSGVGTLVIGGLQDYDPGAAFNILGGALVLNTDAGSQGADLSMWVTGAELRFACNQHLHAATISGNAKVVFAGANCVVLKDLAIGGKVDVATGNLVVDYDGWSPLVVFRPMLASGCAGGLWNGPGIASSAAAADPDDLTAVGIVDNADPKVGGKTTFAGETVDATSVLVKYTYWGDANLDGVVDANDYDVIDKNFLFTPDPDNMGWWTGDFNYDDVIDANDYDLIDKAFLFQTGPLGTSTPFPTPEPATLAMLALGAAALAARRKG